MNRFKDYLYINSIQASWKSRNSQPKASSERVVFVFNISLNDCASELPTLLPFHYVNVNAYCSPGVSSFVICNYCWCWTQSKLCSSSTLHRALWLPRFQSCSLLNNESSMFLVVCVLFGCHLWLPIRLSSVSPLFVFKPSLSASAPASPSLLPVRISNRVNCRSTSFWEYVIWDLHSTFSSFNVELTLSASPSAFPPPSAMSLSVICLIRWKDTHEGLHHKLITYSTGWVKWGSCWPSVLRSEFLFPHHPSCCLFDKNLNQIVSQLLRCMQEFCAHISRRVQWVFCLSSESCSWPGSR